MGGRREKIKENIKTKIDWPQTHTDKITNSYLLLRHIQLVYCQIISHIFSEVSAMNITFLSLTELSEAQSFFLFHLSALLSV